MTSFVLVESAILLGPLLGFASARWLDRTPRRVLLFVAGGCAGAYAFAAETGISLVPPLGALPLALGIVAFWLLVPELRPVAEPTRRQKIGYWAPVGLAVGFNYLLATAGVLGVGFVTAGFEPEGRHDLGEGTVAQATYLGGPGLDHRGWEVELRRPVPVIGIFERVVESRAYFWDQAMGREPPTFDTVTVDGTRAVVVRLARSGDPRYPNPDTLRLHGPSSAAGPTGGSAERIP